MWARLYTYPYKVIRTWFRPVQKLKPEKVGLMWPWLSKRLKEGWPPLVLDLPEVIVQNDLHTREMGDVSSSEFAHRIGPRSNWTYSLVFIRPLQTWPFWGGAIILSPWKGPHKLGLNVPRQLRTILNQLKNEDRVKEKRSQGRRPLRRVSVPGESFYSNGIPEPAPLPPPPAAV
jgi:hypothetical protein